MNELVPLLPAPGVPARQLDAETLIQRWMEGRAPNTMRAYGRDLAYFARWRGA
jgi:hypothetical protein